MADLRIEEYNVGDIGTNCYFIVNADTKEMVIIDPGGDGADVSAVGPQVTGLHTVALIEYVDAGDLIGSQFHDQLLRRLLANSRCC